MEEIINIEVQDNRTLIIECLVNGKTRRMQMTFEALRWYLKDLFKE